MQSFIEKVWGYRNMQCSVIHTTLGHRCGYVVVPDNMEVPRELVDEEAGWDYVDLNVHGGITFEEDTKFKMGTRSEVCGIMVGGDTKILGFDCAHAYDNSDEKLTIKRFGGCGMPSFSNNGTIKTQPYCEAECRSMVDQIIEFNRSI